MNEMRFSPPKVALLYVGLTTSGIVDLHGLFASPIHFPPVECTMAGRDAIASLYRSVRLLGSKEHYSLARALNIFGKSKIGSYPKEEKMAENGGFYLMILVYS